MPNYWSNKSLEVISATPYPVHGYGYLYIFRCVRRVKNKEIPFYQVSQIFVNSKIELTPKNIYTHFKKMEGVVGISPITSLNRKEERGLDWAIGKATVYADSQNAENSEETSETEQAEGTTPIEEPVTEKVEEPAKKTADPEWVSNLLKETIEKWNSENKEKGNNWYNRAKRFVKVVIANKK